MHHPFPPQHEPVHYAACKLSTRRTASGLLHGYFRSWTPPLTGSFDLSAPMFAFNALDRHFEADIGLIFVR
jgi:hypothetical protein